MNIGYACLTLGVPGTELKSCTMKNATPDRLRELIAHNLNSLESMLRYNARMGIRLFRISSDLIPFGSSPANTLDWRHEFMERFAEIGRLAAAHGMRLSMHPGQYTVLNSPDSGVVERAVEDLRYHNDVLDLLGLPGSCKIILHIGGIYGDKPAAVERFRTVYRTLDAGVRGRLVIENDERLYTAEDVLEIGRGEGIPVVFDNLHHRLNPGAGGELSALVRACGKTWRAADGPQKTHCSQQAPGRKPGSHSDTIRVQEFLEYIRCLPKDCDVMLEVKDKNLSAVKCILCTGGGRIKDLEAEWARYKYLVLERSPANYQGIRTLLKDKAAYPAPAFYRLVEEAVERVPALGESENALLHVWGYFKGIATESERKAFARSLEKLRAGETAPAAPKRMLHRLAMKYEVTYLLESLYFVL